jgi:hypothetical protein
VWVKGLSLHWPPLKSSWMLLLPTAPLVLRIIQAWGFGILCVCVCVCVCVCEKAQIFKASYWPDALVTRS